MTNVPALIYPTKPLPYFEDKREERYIDGWQQPTLYPDSDLHGYVIWLDASSSSYRWDTMRVICQVQERWYPAPTKSRPTFISHSDNWIHAEIHTTSVSIEDASENLFEIRRLTGFSWDKLASLLNVDNHILNDWVMGAKIQDRYREHIAKTLEVLRFGNRKYTESNEAGLKEQGEQHDLGIFKAVRARDYEKAKQYLYFGFYQPHSKEATTDTTSWIGEYQPMLMHPDADGTEKIEALPDEPTPEAIKRPIRRG